MECYICKKQMPVISSRDADKKLYDLRGFKVCWDCYWKQVDKEQSEAEDGD